MYTDELWNFYSHVLSLPGTFMPWNFRSLELSLPRAKMMLNVSFHNENGWNFICPGTNIDVKAVDSASSLLNCTVLSLVVSRHHEIQRVMTTAL